jgi:hypothetical protein
MPPEGDLLQGIPTFFLGFLGDLVAGFHPKPRILEYIQRIPPELVDSAP